jgi:flagellar basal-body rod protein FlgB
MASELLVAAISKSLDGLALRQLATSQNIANANSPGYVPLRVEFESALASEVQRAQSGTGSVASIRALQPRLVQDPLSIVGESVRIDQEIASSSETAMRYSALISVLDRLFTIKNVAVSGS